MNEARTTSNLKGLGLAVGVTLAIFALPILVLAGSQFGYISAGVVIVAVIIGLVFLRTEETVHHHHEHQAQEPPTMLAGAVGIRLEGKPKVGWLSQAILSGFIASMTMLIAFALAYAVALSVGNAMGGGNPDTASRATMGRWLYNLANNPVTNLAQNSLYFSVGLHVTLGLVWAGIYASFVEPRMWGPHWARGAVFATVPFLFSVLLFFPLTGGGLLGIGLGAGPLPFLGNLVLHVIYGSVLGAMYGPWGDVLPAMNETHTPEHYRQMADAEGAAAKGVLGGLVIGLVIGAFSGAFIQPNVPNLTGPPQLSVLGAALMGGALGALVGSMFGLPAGQRASTD